MGSTSENRPGLPTASNQDAPWRRLAEACREVVVCPPAAAPHIALRAALEAAGAERAFVVRRPVGPEDDPQVVDSLALQGDRPGTPSRSAVRRALRARGPLVCADLRHEPALGGEASVRALALRSVLSAPLPCGSPPRVLVLDSRRPSEQPASALADLVSAFASLLALLLEERSMGVGPTLHDGPALVGGSRAFRALIDQARSLARVRLPVLVLGESGSGKEGVARLLHAASARAGGPFVAVNCTAIPESLLESELFGTVRGAYTGAARDRPGLIAAAHGGALFLDEVGDMPLSMQARLLRTLQDGGVRPVGSPEEVRVDVRIITATHRDLWRLVAEGAFRLDLYYRISVFTLRVPALRERLDDLPELAAHLLTRLRHEVGIGPARLGAGALRRLRSHDWPGNVRELHAVMARALVRSAGGVLEAEHIDLHGAPAPPEKGDAKTALEETMIVQALRDCAGSVTRAASRIGWSRQKLYRRMDALGLERTNSSHRRGA